MMIRDDDYYWNETSVGDEIVSICNVIILILNNN